MAAPGVVITGLGICSPLGPDRETTWRRLLAGDSGLGWADAARHLAGGRAQLAAEHDPKLRVRALTEQVADEAVRDSRLTLPNRDPTRCGCVFGTSKGELETLLEASVGLPWTELWPSSAAECLARRFDLQGPVLAPVAACATGLVACIRAAELIQADLCDVVLAGSADASLFPAVSGSFQRLGVLAKPGVDPSAACRPFDRNRSGFLIGEGGACLVLERRSHAAARGAFCYGEWIAGRLGSDPSGLTKSDATGAALARVLGDLLRHSARRPDYINLHGTATKLNDVAECRAVRTVLGASAGVSCSGLKGSLGHLLGAAGSVELALTLLALRDQIVPPSLNLQHPDPDCGGLDLTPCAPRRRTIDTAVKISSGFGGHIAVAAVGRG